MSITHKRVTCSLIREDVFIFEYDLMVCDGVVDQERIKYLNDTSESNGSFILYWMQQSQRTSFNHALNYAIHQSNQKKVPVIVYFGLTDQYPDANSRHYQFMLEGLSEIEKDLASSQIQFVLRKEDPSKGCVNLADEATLVIVDCGYTRIQRQWRAQVGKVIHCPLIQVESDVVVPIETASPKEEYGAYTIRPKLHKHIRRFLKPLPPIKPKFSSLSYTFDSLDLNDIDEILRMLSIDRSVITSKIFRGGNMHAQHFLKEFILKGLTSFSSFRNDPSKQVSSHMSPYLHFGQISPIDIALQIERSNHQNSADFLEELIIRRELAMNFVYYNTEYDSLSCLPDWAYKTLEDHEKDKREYIYSERELEQADTHDEYWNAAQKEMMITGKMHGYLRMYWGKKILEWSENPKKAYQTALYLNNKYELDGRDPNGFAGVAWCFGKHDRAWGERLIFGKIRYMSKDGLKRKGDLNRYLRRIERLEKS